MSEPTRECGCLVTPPRPFRGPYAGNRGTCVCCNRVEDVIVIPAGGGAVSYCVACMHVAPASGNKKRGRSGHLAGLPFRDEDRRDDYVKVHIPNSLRAYVARMARGVTAESVGLDREVRRAQTFKGNEAW